MRKKIRNIVESVVEGLLSTPDCVMVNGEEGGKCLWTEKAAIPFFVMPTGEILYGEPGKRHIDHTKEMPTGAYNDMVNKIVLQGRFWKDRKIFSFWDISEDDWSLVLETMVNVCNKFNINPEGASVYYMDNVVTLEYDERYNEYRLSYGENNVETNKTKIVDGLSPDEWVNYIIDGNMEFNRKEYVKLSFNSLGTPNVEELNEYELLCLSIDDAYRNTGIKNGTNNKCNVDEFDLYLYKTYGHRLKKFMSDFHTMIRNRLIPRSRVGEDVGKIESHKKSIYEHSELEMIVTNAGLSNSEYKIRFHQDGTPYSINVKTPYKEKMEMLKKLANNVDYNVVIDRIGQDKMNGKITIYYCRIRQKQTA